jgi:hypothetical protein
MVFNTTFNNISAITWLSVLLVEETGGPGENHLIKYKNMYVQGQKIRKPNNIRVFWSKKVKGSK